MHTPELSLPEYAATITFPAGLVGFEGWKRFELLVDDEQDLPVAILQCLDEPQVRLMVTDPLVLRPDYEIKLSYRDRVELELGQQRPTTYCTLSLADDGWLTANLLGPLLINPTTRIGKQLMLADAGYSTRHPIVQLSPEARVACSS
jgi:flagellar assembly factor FliW